MTVPVPSPFISSDLAFESVYGSLRSQARRFLRYEQNANSMSPTILVHEAWMNLARSRALTVNNRDHYVSLTSRVMKNLLIDHARRKKAISHGGELRRVEWSELSLAAHDDCDLILAVAAAMKQLAAVSPRMAELVELRYFSGFTEGEAAQILGISIRTVRRQWKVARLRLMQSLQPAAAMRAN